jgi:hypothetical protein
MMAFREWASSSSEEGRHGGIAGCGQVATVRRTRQGVALVRYERHSKAVRPLCFPRLDLVQELGSRPCAWSKLEPLTES